MNAHDYMMRIISTIMGPATPPARHTRTCTRISRYGTSTRIFQTCITATATRACRPTHRSWSGHPLRSLGAEIGSPGMEFEGQPGEVYAVWLFEDSANRTRFAQHDA